MCDKCRVITTQLESAMYAEQTDTSTPKQGSFPAQAAFNNNQRGVY